MATLPMGAFFGRMVNYEPLCLFAVMLQLDGYAIWRQEGRGAAFSWPWWASCSAG